MDWIIAHQQDSEAALRLEAIIKTATDGIIIIDARGIIELVNEAAARLFAYSEEELLGQNISMLMPNPHRDAHDVYIQNYLQTGLRKIIGIGREVLGLRKDQSTFPLRLSISEVRLPERIVFTGILHDLTAEKAAEARIVELNQHLEEEVNRRTEELATTINKLLNTNNQLEFEIQERKVAEATLRKNEQELRKAIEKERELNTLKSRFVSMASHEFRTPLSTILSSADLLEMYSSEEQQEKRLRHTTRIKSAVNNLISILNDFLSLSKLEEGKIEVTPVEFNLEEFCDEVMDDVQALLKPGQILQHHGLSADTLITLDKKMLKNVFINLFSNAIKYSEPGKSIDCYVAIENNELNISIQDHGIGIPEEEQQHLFTRFFRAHNAENIPGTGLGLNIVKRYVELMNGRIHFESTMGEGTTFHVHIPLPS
ncbi:MAG: PAS domain-containing sensor histidine kinase [Haliscomenobacter sp.]|uniref:PAS domain-containing sensor histidine kinase n=1 Tax=Haliscomenobacter sp. TaxID=2717303 RepID=UPI0029B9E5E0|nr:PAS domain-containing sensor histidine kinase [Haliscomenobacter sp.]MDX2069574.1 PAS domain-containing sensor histidine kinase [Haliscomenobacter sp.]